MSIRLQARPAHWLTLSVMLLGSAPALAAPSGERLPPSAADSLTASRTALRRWLERGESAEARRGGKVALASREYEVTDAKLLESWLAWLPDFSLALRRQYDRTSSGNVYTPRWRVDVEGQASFSLQKFAAASAARAARAKAQAEVAQARHVARQATLFRVVELYLAERKALPLRAQLDDFERLASSLAGARGDGDGDAILLNARLAELRGELAKVERERRDAAERLGAELDAPVEASGIDPRLGATELIELIGATMSASPSRTDDVLRAELDLQRERLRFTQSQAWYQPQLRANGVAQFPKSDPGAVNGDNFRLAGITAEFSLGLRVRPGIPSLETAAEQAVLRSEFEGAQSRWKRGQLADRARAIRDALAQLWGEQRGVSAARTSYEDITQRFMRGERTATELSASSRSLLETELERDAILEQALIAQIVLSSDSEGGRATPTNSSAPIPSAEANQLVLRAASDAAAVKAALAEARRAQQNARGESFPLQTSVDAGVSVPLYENSALNVESRPLLAFAGTSTLTTPVREVSALGRWTVDLRGVGTTASAAAREAELRAAELTLTRKRYLWAALSARLELAHARMQLTAAERAVEVTSGRVALERRWLQQGAANDEDLRNAELAQRNALLARGRAEARERAAALLVGSYLGAPRGTPLSVDETPHVLEAWAREHLFPEQQLHGFEGALAERVALLEVEALRSRTEALARPPRATTFAAQATQGVHGGAFSLTVALSVSLDPLRDPPQATRAAQAEGAARGRLLALQRRLEQQRTRLQERIAAATRELETERDNAQRLSRLEATLRDEQAALPDVHDAVRERGRAALETARIQSELRRLDAEERLRSASLEVLALGANATTRTPTGAAPAPSPSLNAALAILRDERSDVMVADAVAREVGVHSRAVPVASALHLVGPFSVGSYSATRVTGPSTTKILQADQGIGLSLALDEAVSFGSLAKLRQSAQLEQKAARRRTEREAVREVAEAWTARELERLSRAEEAAAQHYVEDSVAPRFALGQVTPGLLTSAEVERTRARSQHAADDTAFRAARAALAAQGVTLDDALLDDFQRRASTALPTESTGRQPVASASPDELAAQARSAAGSYDVAASGLRLLSPVTGLLEFRPARIDFSSGTGDARVTSSDREQLWVLSLLVPLRLQAIGRLSVDMARSRLAEEELGTASREARAESLRLARAVVLSRNAHAAAVAERESVERALAEVERRFRNQERRTSIDEVVQARKALFEARRSEILAAGAAFEAVWSLQTAGSP
ncbi:MAG TPA: hypothetical protein VFQ35_26625 [Polyangiaceae bacterium]|nr:hypothetical protein [Polyangiaceae bacterium]